MVEAAASLLDDDFLCKAEVEVLPLPVVLWVDIDLWWPLG